MTRLGEGSWVVVADGEKAMIFETEQAEGRLFLHIRREEAQDNPPDRDQASDRPGCTGNRAGGQGSAMEEVDFHRQAKERFAAELAALLYRNAHRGAYRSLVIAAPPLVLGALRPHLHKEVQERLLAELPKTLTGHPVPEIARILAEELEAA